MINCMSIFKSCRDTKEDNNQIINNNDKPHTNTIGPSSRKEEDPSDNKLKESQILKSSGFKFDLKPNPKQGESIQPNVSFSFTSSSQYSEAFPSMKKISFNSKGFDNHYKWKEGNNCDDPKVFFDNDKVNKEKSLNESLKQLQFSYIDDDMEETKFNTNNKKNSLSDSKDQIIPKMIIEHREYDDKEEKLSKERKSIIQTSRQVIILKEASMESNESNSYVKAKTKKSENNEALDKKVQPKVVEDKPSGTLNKVLQSQQESNFIQKRLLSRNSLRNFKDSKIQVENYKGVFISNTVTIDTKGIEGGLRNKRDGSVYFGFDQFDSKGPTVNDVLLNQEPLQGMIEGYKHQALFTIFFDMNCQKFFFQPVKTKSKQKLKVYFNVTCPFHFISSQTFEMNCFIVTLDPNAKDNTISIQLNQDTAISITQSKKVYFTHTLNGLELLTSLSSNDTSSLCYLHYEKGKELWTLVPQSSHIWLSVNCKQSLEKAELIKYGTEAILKVSPIK